MAGAHPILADELVQPRERCLGRLDRARASSLLLGGVVLEPQHSDHGRERKPLHDQRDEDDREREEEDQAPVRKRLSGSV